LSACGNNSSNGASGGGTLTIQGDAGNPTLVENFNPFQGSQLHGTNLIYEPLEIPSPIDGTYTPFLATGYADAMKLYKASRKVLEDRFAKQGIKLLYAVAWPPQGIFTNRTLNSVADMKGLKWRAYSPATSRIAELVGAQPVTVQASELTQALATGVVDSYMSSPSTGFDTKTYESIKTFYDTQAWLPKNAVIVNQQAFDALDKPTQDAVLKAGKAAQAYYEGKADQVNKDAIKAFEDHKVKVVTLSDAEYQAWLEVAKKSSYATFAKAVPNGQKLIDEALAVK